MKYMFRPLEPPVRSTASWMVSLLVHCVFVALIIALPVAVHESLKSPASRSMVLLEPGPRVTPFIRPKLPKTPLRIVHPFQMPAKIETRLASPISAPIPQAPAMDAARMSEPRLDLPAPAPMPAPIREVKPGGFGDPAGVPASRASDTSKVLAAVGSFDLPAGTGHGGAGASRMVASAGFGDSAAPGIRGNDRTQVRSAGFGDAQSQLAAVPHAASPKVAAQTPVEIISKPRPAYTAEARASKLEGEVLLEVVFSSGGSVQVVRVVRGLGLGLDESARTAASQIRFRPGTRDGVPVDMKGIVHIVFELS